MGPTWPVFLAAVWLALWAGLCLALEVLRPHLGVLRCPWPGPHLG